MGSSAPEDREGWVHGAWRIRGRVQGVGFRWWTRETAEDLGLTGWVRNRPDGSVAVQAEGPAGRLEEFAGRLGQGPYGARVDDVQEVAWDGDARENGFAILR